MRYFLLIAYLFIFQSPETFQMWNCGKPDGIEVRNEQGLITQVIELNETFEMAGNDWIDENGDLWMMTANGIGSAEYVCNEEYDEEVDN